MKQYLDLLAHTLENGTLKGDRTGTGTRSVFGSQLRFNLSEGFPIVTTKRVHFKSVVHELIWFLNGDTNTKYLKENGVSIWDEWATEEGSLGAVYGKQWRDWVAPDGRHIDQISHCIEQIKNNPNSRRIIFSGWNVADLPDESLSPQENVKKGKMALAPCHVLYQFYVAEGRLSLHIFQRSCDLFLGNPFNLASGSLLIHMMAQQCDLEPGELVWSGSDCHIYSNHIEQVKTQLSRAPKKLPQLKINRKPNSLFEYQFSDFELVGYEHHPRISAPIAV